MARLLLAIALNSSLAEIAGLATDALTAAIDDGRIDPPRLAEALVIAWRLRDDRTAEFTAFVKPGRWAKTLGDVRRASALHARVVAEAIEPVLADESTASRTTASALPLLALLKEASIESGRAVSAAARVYLGRIAIAGKTGRVAKDLLSLAEVPRPPALNQAQMQALASRIARAERWMSWR